MIIIPFCTQKEQGVAAPNIFYCMQVRMSARRGKESN